MILYLHSAHPLDEWARTRQMNNFDQWFFFGYNLSAYGTVRVTNQALWWMKWFLKQFLVKGLKSVGALFQFWRMDKIEPELLNWRNSQKLYHRWHFILSNYIIIELNGVFFGTPFQARWWWLIRPNPNKTPFVRRRWFRSLSLHFHSLNVALMHINRTLKLVTNSKRMHRHRASYRALRTLTGSSAYIDRLPHDIRSCLCIEQNTPPPPIDRWLEQHSTRSDHETEAKQQTLLRFNHSLRICFLFSVCVNSYSTQPVSCEDRLKANRKTAHTA